MWNEITKHPLTCSVSKFQQAIEVWILKPHTVNRRLVGAKIEKVEEQFVPCNDIWLPEFLCHLKEDFSCASLNTLLKCQNRGAVKEVQVVIRELIPRQLGRFHSATEIIIKDNYNFEYIFLPLFHKDESGRVCHEDNTLGYCIKYDAASQSLRVYGTKEFEESPCTSQGVSKEWLQNILIPKLVNWCNVASELTTEITSLKLVPVEKYTLLYQNIKEQHGKRLVEMWPESTDPYKYVYEDVAIAAYLILLWQEMHFQTTEEKPEFIDLGCGNGLLVHILVLMGYKGYGIDIRKRNVWESFGSETNLKVESITPDMVFPKNVWLIGNHSDELTPWIPVISLRSQCNFFLLPCCPWNFTGKFSAKKSGVSLYRNYLSFVEDVINVCGFSVEEDMLRIPSTKRVCFVGRHKTYSKEHWPEINKEVNAFIQSKQQLQKSDAVENYTCDSKISEAEHSGPNHAAENTQSDQLNSDSSSFKPRCYENEKKSHCLTLHMELKNYIVKTVFEKLLTASPVEILELPNSNLQWNRGGSLPLSAVIHLFSKDTLQQLKSECGGIQTLLRNHHHIFLVQGGSVKLRNWTNATEHEIYQSVKKKRKGNDKCARDFKSLTKTKLCFFHDHHPNGCPLEAEQCRFAHGIQELKKL